MGLGCRGDRYEANGIGGEARRSTTREIRRFSFLKFNSVATVLFTQLQQCCHFDVPYMPGKII